MDDRDLYKSDSGRPPVVSCPIFERQNRVRIRCPFRKAHFLHKHCANGLKTTCARVIHSAVIYY